MKAEVKIPDGWRKLEPGEYTKPGDRWFSHADMDWDENTDCFCSECGHVIKTNIVPEKYEIESGWLVIRRVSKRKRKA